MTAKKETAKDTTLPTAPTTAEPSAIESIMQKVAVPSMFDKIDNPIEAAKEMGEWINSCGFFGCDPRNPSQGNMIALASILEKTNPLEIQRRYHIIHGKLSKKADAMLADLSNAGGTFEWIEDGDDHKCADILIKFKGREGHGRFTMEDAQRAGLLNSNQNWNKYPGNQLRARAVSNGMRKVAPELVTGLYTPEEIADMDEIRAPQQPVSELFGDEEVQAQQPVKGEVVAPAEVVSETPQEEPAPPAADNTQQPPAETESPDYQLAELYKVYGSKERFGPDFAKFLADKGVIEGDGKVKDVLKLSYMFHNRAQLDRMLSKWLDK